MFSFLKQRVISGVVCILLNAKFAKISAWYFAKVAGLSRRCKTPSPAPDTFLHKNDQTRGIDIEDGDSCRDVKIVTSRALRSPHLRLATNPPNTYIVPFLSSPWLRDVKFVFHQLGESQIVAIPLKTKA